MKTNVFRHVSICLMLMSGMQQVNGQTATTAKTLYVQVNGDKIAYRSFGKGSPMVLATRMRGTIDTWDPLFLDKLAEVHNVITFDYPGIGYSTGSLPPDIGQVAKFVNDFATEIKLKKFALAGWSWGGLVAQAVLLEYPERLTHAILIGTNPPGKVENPTQQFWIDRALKPVNDLADEEILFFEPKSEASVKAAKLSHDRIYKRPGVESKIPSTIDVFQLYFKGAQGFKEDKANLKERLTKTTLSILIICGDNDPSVPVENWYPLIGEIPAGQLIVLPGTGHGPQHQYPELSAKYMIEFIKYTAK